MRSSSTEEWLAVLAWACTLILNPSPRTLLESFESWNYRNRLRPTVRNLRRKGMLECSGGHRHRWNFTEKGRLAAQGGIDAPQRWARTWDGRWRMLLFDIPERLPGVRIRLWRWMKRHRFGFLQQSVWITPDPLAELEVPLTQFQLKPESMTVVEAMPVSPGHDERFVQGAWNFQELNAKYQAAMDVTITGHDRVERGDPAEIHRWLAAERNAWMNAIEDDPFLPARLLPADYLGQKAWDVRQRTFSTIAKIRYQKMK